VRRPKRNPATAGYGGQCRGGGKTLCGKLLVRHDTPRGPIASLAFKLLLVGYIAKLGFYEPHRHIAGRTAWMN
jgi:hypothetical protein